MNSDRIKEIQETTAYPQSVSVMLALKQVWNECAQEQSKKRSAVDGLACTCGNKTFTHRHSNWIECTDCHKIQVL